MSDGNDSIPRWVGRVVTTADLPAPCGRTGVEPTTRDVADRQPSPSDEEPPSPESSGLLLVVAAIAGLLVAATIVIVAPDRATFGETEVAEQTGTSESDGDRSGAEAAQHELTPDDTPAAERTPDTAIPGLSAADLEAHRGEAWSAGEALWAIYIGGRVHIQGQVPDTDAAAPLIERLQSALGPGEVIAQYGIDPTSPLPTDPPLFIEETVVFESGSARIRGGSQATLAFAGLLMQRYPAATLTVVADSTAPAQPGDAADLPEQRIQAIVDLLVQRGIDVSRLDTEPRRDGLGDAEAGVKPIEFVVRGLLEEDRGSR